MAVKLKFKKGALQKIRKDHRVTAELVKMAKQVAQDAGGEDMGYMVTDLVLEDPRSAVSVMATGHAHFHNRKHHALLKALSRAKR